ncbi:pleckstrin homology domain-containing family H member 2 isoform X2 [Daphnia magna]|uniref:pleckstrin homology domain-containing family H member 2 isoform X2 n=1 Tax=Daphnia magna TaxID=35525 RepID=UPI001402EF1B|nr:pleckstrin homology domain-containing family H member 2 isoform X2 [Daphnia magna]
MSERNPFRPTSSGSTGALVTDARLSQLFDPIARLVDVYPPNDRRNAGYHNQRDSSEYAHLTAYPAIIEPVGYDEGTARLSYMSSNSPSIKRRSLDRPSSSQSHSNSFLRPSSVQYHYRRQRLSDNNFQRTSITSQTSSLHTALSELAGDVEVVDMEDGALTNDRYSHNYQDGEVDSETTMAASSSGEGFWFSDSRNYHHHGEQDHASMMMGVMDDEDQYGDEETYLPYVYSMEGGDPGVNWEERCLELEMSLQRFRDQAGKIRGLLREKLAEMEARVVGAETRAEIAEEKLRIMEQQLADSPWNPLSESTTGSPGVHQTSVKERDVINRLEDQVDEQRKMRLNDAKQVEAKAAKIKEWVTNKLKDLEEQNQHLREQNQKCNEQLELLRSRLRQLSQTNSSNSKNHRASTEDSSRGSLEDQPGSDDSLCRVGGGNATEGGKGRGSGSVISPCDATSQLDALYAEVDLSKKRQQRCASGSGCMTSSMTSSYGGGGGGLGLSGPVNSMMQQRFPDGNRLSLSGLTRTVRDSRVDSGSVDMETPLSLSPKSPISGGLNDDHACSHNSGSIGKKPIPPPRTRVPRKDSDNSVNDGNVSDHSGSGGVALMAKGNCPSAGTLSGLSDADTYENGATTALGELGQAIDQAIASMTAAASEHSDYDVPKPPRSLKLISSEVHDYAEIYTPSKERVPWNGSAAIPMSTARHSISHPGSLVGSVGDDYHDDSKPPTPPLHRFPSWESRIYQAAAEGFSVSEQPPSTIPLQIHQIHPNHNQQSRALTHRLSNTGSVGYHDISIPVYATVKGRASQIRSVPFSGDSSDSSDGEDHADVRDNCNESAISDDYALPPDDNGPEAEAAIVAQSVAMLRISTLERHSDELEKSGYLTKLSGKLKTWRKRWFVLKNGTLSYWKSQSDLGRKPQGQISLDDSCRVWRADGAATFEISTSKKTHYLTADSSSTVDEWVRILQNVVRRNTTRLLLGREDQKPTLEGWIVKVKHGHSKRCWCMLVGKTFLYFKAPNDQVPQGQINMRDARVEELEHVSDSDSEDVECNSMATARSANLTVGIFPPHEDPTYLLLANKQEKDAWLYQLTIVSGGGAHSGTQYEQMIQKLMETDGDPNCNLWRNPLLIHSKDSITSPLTTLPSESLHNEAIKLFKAIQLFTSALLDSAGIDYHVVLAQNALHQCLCLLELQPELICALIKQTSRVQPQSQQPVVGVAGVGSKWVGGQVNRSALHKISKPAKQSTHKLSTALPPSSASGSHHLHHSGSISSGSSSSPDSKAASAPFTFVQGWQLLALTVSLFAPRNNKLLWYLRLHLKRNADTKTEMGKYASYCQRALERTLQMGPREAKPSRMEVLSILLKNPYHHSLPHAIPVHFLNGTYQVVGFDGSTTVEEFLVTLNREIGCRDVSQSGFALFSDDPIEKDEEHWLEPKAKLCDIISKWETALREKGLGKFQNTKVIRLTYRHRLFWRSNLKGETERERLLHCYQTAQRISDNRFPLTKELAIELAAIMSQIDGGDYNAERGRGSGGSSGHLHQGAMQALERFIPRRYKDGISQEELKEMADAITDKWTALKGRSIADCVRIYLTCTRKWPFFGAALFHAKVNAGGGNSDLEGASVWLAINEETITLLDVTSMQSVARVPYSAVVTFGGCQDDLMVVVNNCDIQGPGTQKMLFALPKPKILELTLLIADYMNALGCVLPSTPNASLSRLDSRRSGRSKTKERDSDRSGSLSHRMQASVEPDILRATPEMESKMQHHHHHQHLYHEEAGNKRRITTDS